MKKGLYKSANKYYTDAIEQERGMLLLYTNRALALLKLEMWQDAIDDCTRPLEYCEVFDDGYTKQPDLCYKALIRRA
jgi:tetratricopeptide (TPR) repeat protein